MEMLRLYILCNQFGQLKKNSIATKRSFYNIWISIRRPLNREDDRKGEQLLFMTPARLCINELIIVLKKKFFCNIIREKMEGIVNT